MCFKHNDRDACIIACNRLSDYGRADGSAFSETAVEVSAEASRCLS